MTYEQASLVAIVLGPLLAVLITLWHQDRTRKREAKERLFISLMAHRKSFPPSYEWVNALNLIDVVFATHPRVVGLWHELYELYYGQVNVEARTHKQLELLTAMAETLGYRSLKQVDMDKFYSPVAHGNQQELSDGLQREFLRVLKASKNLGGGDPPSP